MLNETRFRKHEQEVDRIPMDLICDGRLNRRSVCDLRVRQIEEYFLKTKERAPVDVSLLSPCKECLQKNNTMQQKSIVSVLNVWKNWSGAIQVDELEKAVDNENVTLVVMGFKNNEQFVLKRCIKMNSSTLMKTTLSKIIENQAYKMLSWSFEYMEVFLSCRCVRREIQLECPVILVLYHRNKISKYPLEMFGLRLVLKSTHQFENKRRRRPHVNFPCKREVTISPTILADLFTNHRNLNKISYNQRQENSELIVTFHCWEKGLIPFGEDLFPKKIAGFKTKVCESFARFSSRVDLYIGDEIGVLKENTVSSTGTVGGFLEKIGVSYGLTCAHVLYDEKELVRDVTENLPVVSRDGKVYGKRFNFAFKYGNLYETSIDAALVKIDQNVQLHAEIPEKNDNRLKTAGFDTRPFFTGKTADINNSDLINRCCIKYGSATGLTRGSFLIYGTHARMKNIDMQIDSCKEPSLELEQVDMTMTELQSYRRDESTDKPHPKSYEMCNQLEIDPQQSVGNFFENGDSGSLVFIQESDKSLTAVGMAIGVSSTGSCITTPINAVLNELDRKISSTSDTEELHFKTNIPLISQNAIRSKILKNNPNKRRFHPYKRCQKGGIYCPEVSETISIERISLDPQDVPMTINNV